MDRSLDEVRDVIMPVLRRHGVRKASLFGSIARNELREDSDVDVRVELPEEKSALDIVALKSELEDVLGRRVDVAEYSGLHPLLRDRILAHQVAIL